MATSAVVVHTPASAGPRTLTRAQLTVADAPCRALFASSLTAILAAAVAGGLDIAWSGPGGAGEGIGVGGGELADTVQEVADHQELIVGVAGEEVAGATDEVAEDFLVPGGGGLGGLYQLAAAVAGIGPPADVPGLLQPIKDGGHPAGGEAEQPGQGGGGQRSGPAEDVQGAHVGAVQAVPVCCGLVEPVDLRAQRPEAVGDLAGEYPLRHNNLPIW